MRTIRSLLLIGTAAFALAPPEASAAADGASGSTAGAPGAPGASGSTAGQAEEAPKPAAGLTDKQQEDAAEERLRAKYPDKQPADIIEALDNRVTQLETDIAYARNNPPAQRGGPAVGGGAPAAHDLQRQIDALKTRLDKLALH